MDKREIIESKLDQVLSDLDLEQQEKILRYAVDHIIPKLKKIKQPDTIGNVVSLQQRIAELENQVELAHRGNRAISLFLPDGDKRKLRIVYRDVNQETNAIELCVAIDGDELGAFSPQTQWDYPNIKWGMSMKFGNRQTITFKNHD